MATVTHLFNWRDLDDRLDDAQYVAPCLDDLSHLSDSELRGIIGQGEKAREELCRRVVSRHREEARKVFLDLKQRLEEEGAGNITLVDGLDKPVPGAMWRTTPLDHRPHANHFIDAVASKLKKRGLPEDSAVAVILADVDRVGSNESHLRRPAIKFALRFEEEQP